MSLYKAFFKIAKKNKLGILIYFGITVFIIVLLGGIYANKKDKKAVLDSYKIYVLDEDETELSKELTAYLGSIHQISEETLSEEQIMDSIFYEELVAYIRIPKGFQDTFLSTGENQVKNTYDDSMPVGLTISLQMNNFLNSVRDYLEQGVSIAEAAKKTNQSLDITKYVSILETEGVENGKLRGAFTYIPFGILSILITGIFPVVAGFNKGEKRNRIQVSSMPAGKRSFWIFAGAVTFSLIILVGLVAFVSVMGEHDQLFNEAWWLSVLNALIFTSVVAMMISMFANVPAFASAPSMVFSNIVGLSFCFIGGTFVPLSILGDGITKISRFIPNYWYSIAVERIYEGGGLADVWDCFAIQLAFGLVCLFIGLAASRVSAERKQMA